MANGTTSDKEVAVDDAEFLEAFSEHLDRLHNLARGLTRTAQDAEDLLSETCGRRRLDPRPRGARAAAHAAAGGPHAHGPGGYTAAQTAQIVGAPRGTVLARVHRGRKVLPLSLASEREGDGR